MAPVDGIRQNGQVGPPGAEKVGEGMKWWSDSGRSTHRFHHRGIGRGVLAGTRLWVGKAVSGALEAAGWMRWPWVASRRGLAYCRACGRVQRAGER